LVGWIVGEGGLREEAVMREVGPTGGEGANICCPDDPIIACHDPDGGRWKTGKGRGIPWGAGGEEDGAGGWVWRMGGGGGAMRW